MRNNVFLYEFVSCSVQDFLKVFFLLFLFTSNVACLINIIFVSKDGMCFLNKHYTKRKSTCLTTLVFLMSFNCKFFSSDIFLCAQYLGFNKDEKRFFFFKKIIHSILHSSKFNHVFSKELIFILNFEFLYLSFFIKSF